MHRARKPLILICAVAVWLSGPGFSGAANPDAQAFDQIEKGHYLTTVADCYACHTVPNVGKPFAGGRAIETPFGVITSSNIPPDADTGIGAWTDEQFENAVRKGRHPDGSRLYPAMPFPAYTKMSRDDVLAIRAYLATVEPVHQPVNSNTLPFPFNIRAAMRAWDALYFTEGEFQPDSHQSPTWNRGAYLVQGPAIARAAIPRNPCSEATRPAITFAASTCRAGLHLISPETPIRDWAGGARRISQAISRPATTG